MKRRQRFQNLLNNENRNTSNGYAATKRGRLSKEGRSSKSGYNLRTFGTDVENTFNVQYQKQRATIKAQKSSCSSVVYAKETMNKPTAPLVSSFAPNSADMEVDTEPKSAEETRLAEFKTMMKNELSKLGADKPETIPEHVVEYIEEISDHVKKTESDFTPEYGYMKR